MFEFDNPFSQHSTMEFLLTAGKMVSADSSQTPSLDLTGHPEFCSQQSFASGAVGGGGSCSLAL